MYWILLGIIFLWVTIWSLKGITFVECYDGRKREEYHAAVWMMIIAFIIYCIPLLNILAFIVYILWFTVIIYSKPKAHYYSFYAELSKENKLHRVLNKIAYYLTKEL